MTLRVCPSLVLPRPPPLSVEELARRRGGLTVRRGGRCVVLPWRSSEIITSYEALVVRGVQRNRRGQRVGTKSPPLSLSGSVGRDRGKPDCDLVISDFMTPRQLLYNVLKTLPCESPVKLIKPSSWKGNREFLSLFCSNFGDRYGKEIKRRIE